MENEFFSFLNSGILHPLHLEPSSEDSCFLNAHSLDQYSHYEPALSSIVSSPADASVSSTNASFAVREVIGKLNKVCNSPTRAPGYTGSCHAGGNNSTNTSCYTTPMNSPPKLSFPVTEQFLKEKLQNLGLVNSMAKNPKYPSLLADAGFTERAAKFSCFGSQSFNERTTQVGLKLNNNELSHRSSSSPCLNAVGSPMGSEENNNTTQIPEEIQGSQEGCSPISMQISCQETGSRTPTDSNSRKRKAVSKGKSGETTKVEESEDSNPKRPKSNEGDRSQNGNGGGNEDEEKQAKASQKPPEAPKDYIHVRARRGQATDSHSLAERVRREKIGERMKLLQDLVPGCNKVTGKALMLDEIINYVQSLQRQVEFLSMKLASINQKRDFNMETLLSKDLTQPNGFFGHHAQRIPQLESSISNGPMVDRLSNAAFRYNIALQFPQVDEFGQGFQQFPTGCEDDLQSIVQMAGFSKNSNYDKGFHL